MTKQYRMLIVYNHKEKILDQEKICQHMEFAGFHIININMKSPMEQNKVLRYTMNLTFLFHLVTQVI